MALLEIINQDLKEAMKSKDSLLISCLRMIKTSLKNKQVEKGDELDDSEIEAVISSMVRRAKEAAFEYRKGGREDLALKEEKETEIFFKYLPEQLSSSDIEKVLREVIAEVSAAGLKDMGKVMKLAMERLAGKAQGKEVSDITRTLLS
jgi:uncharacterized protein YqeY